MADLLWYMHAKPIKHKLPDGVARIHLMSDRPAKPIDILRPEKSIQSTRPGTQHLPLPEDEFLANSRIAPDNLRCGQKALSAVMDALPAFGKPGVTDTQLANITGMSISTVKRALQVWWADGAITHQRAPGRHSKRTFTKVRA